MIVGVHDDARAVTVEPAGPDTWPALADLFGRAGASNGCWCMYWRLGPRYHERPRERNREQLQHLVESDTAPGLLAFAGGRAVGWCQVTRRRDLPWLAQARYLAPVDDVAVWSISCLYVRRDHRGHGVASALIAGAIQVATAAGAPALEAYPIDTDVPGSSRNVFTGTAAMYRRAGFHTVAARTPARPILRRDLR